ncbi:MAG: hypothetical protein DRQ59_11660 [Gammaproteobacteria bacterium]|nr:MAG: hypothetical protein DRQ59_11660 [Gammaproteobacteria bacterium]
MGTAVFTWKCRYGEFAGGIVARHDRNEASASIDRVRSFGPGRYIVSRLTVLLDGVTSGESYADFLTFWKTTIDNGADSFLFKSHTPAEFKVEGEAGGTSSATPVGETFATAAKFLDLSTLVVKVAGVEQTLATDYTVSGNNTAPTITATATFDTGAVTFDYEFYYQVRAGGSFVAGFLNRGLSLADPGAQTIPLSLREVRAGGHLA